MDARFRSNLDMIGRNEPITRKAKFWQSYVRALKGTDDIRAPEHTHRPRGIFRSDYPELHSGLSWPFGKSIFENPIHAADRINVPGYRYLPIATSEFLFHCHKYHDTAKPFDPEQAWADHLNRLAHIDKMYPSKSPLLARHISPPLSTKRLFDIHGEYCSSSLFLLPDIRSTRELIINRVDRRIRKKDLLLNVNDVHLEYVCCISGALYYYYSQPVPRFHFTTPWYNKRTTY
ncbi:uncharacterized protein LOC108622682 [Ceratina calcarata]|uniref:Uncharacterized protein LOC108622682 n=1 Tax=Ceratina calcarata TaxID=156304 RepID=A0AAJ7ITH9_9HYME|nr:uncharacterized protein LOC108622682 [Ceratina calcarata]